MDVLDAGVYAAKWEADVPKGVQPVLWGPIQAKEMGFEGWEWQDGGETGFIAHNPHVRLPAGFGTSTLIVVNRLRKAFLTVYFGGYPADAGVDQRALDAKKVVSACEVFLARLAKRPVQFQFHGEMALVDNLNDASPVEAATGDGGVPENTGLAGAEDAPMVAERSGVWELD